MARQTHFVVQSFTRNRKGKLEPMTAQSFKTKDVALRTAARIAERRAGVLAFAQTADKASGDYDEPIMLARYGEVPPA